ncbi:MAG TPA: glycosyltransferase family 39 protein [Chthoniobacterales bacterium]|nr:glycosyltransferase family 39 protein [Chthoniobacterales bacterium]
MAGDNAALDSIQRPVLPRWFVFLCLLGIIGFAAAIRIRLLQMPFERDEGEYAYAGQLMLQGVAPYKLAYTMKLPGTHAVYALIMAAFGQSAGGIHLGLTIVNAITIGLVYLLGYRLYGQVCGLVAAACFGLIALSESVLGLAAHANHFVTLFVVAGAVILLGHRGAIPMRNIVIAGFLFGLAILMKQSAIAFALCGVMAVWPHDLKSWSLKGALLRGTAFGLAMAGPLIVTILTIRALGVADTFWFWTWHYAHEYAREVSWWDGWLNLKAGIGRLAHAAPGIGLLSIVGFVVALRRPRDFGFWPAVGLSVAASASCAAGLHFREHYFIPILPLMGVWAGVAIQETYKEIRSRTARPIWVWVPLTLVLLALAATTYRHRRTFFRFTPAEVVRYIYGDNPFPEALEIGRYLRDHCAADQSIAVLGSEPEIYFYSGRRSATGYIYVYGIVEKQKYAERMAAEMIQEIETRAPSYVILVDGLASWFPAPGNDPVHVWFQSYAKTHLEQVGFVDILSPKITEYHLDTWAGKYRSAKSGSALTIFRRKTPPDAIDR